MVFYNASLLLNHIINNIYFNINQNDLCHFGNYPPHYLYNRLVFFHKCIPNLRTDRNISNLCSVITPVDRRHCRTYPILSIIYKIVFFCKSIYFVKIKTSKHKSSSKHFFSLFNGEKPLSSSSSSSSSFKKEIKRTQNNDHVALY